MSLNLSTQLGATTEPEHSPPGTPPHLTVAPGLLDHEHTVIREPGESDERYQSRCELLTTLLGFARQSVKPPLAEAASFSAPQAETAAPARRRVDAA